MPKRSTQYLKRHFSSVITGNTRNAVMSAARWSLRLPRVRRLSITGSIGGTPHRSLLRRAEQRRWIQQRPSQRSRPWGSIVSKDNPHAQAAGDGKTAPQGGSHTEQDPQQGRNTQLAATLAEADTSDLVTEVLIPDDPDGVLPKDHPALSILGNSSLVIQRQLEMMNVMLGFEQANRYIIMDGQGQTLGYIAEQDHGIGSAMARQMFKTHRSFTTHIFDAQEREVLRIHRPFAYINSRIRIYDPVPEGGYQSTETSTALQGTSAGSAMNPTSVAQVSPLKLDEMRIIGESQQQWAPLRRKYNLFTYRALAPPPSDTHTPRLESGAPPNTTTTALTESSTPEVAIEAGMSQFAHVNEPFLSWDFTLRDATAQTLGSVNRNFGGFAREIFTDTGVYALRMDSAAQTAILESAEGRELQRDEREATALTLDQRAVTLATAVSIDFDYFSRHSHVGGGGGFMPIFWPMGGGGGAGGAAAGGTAAEGAVVGAGAAGAAGEAATAGAVGAAGRGLGTAAGPAGESAIAGAGTLAGYEAMQRGVYGGSDGASPTNTEPFPGAGGQDPGQMENRPGDDNVWGEQSDPWGRGGGPGDGQPPSAGEGGGEGGGGLADAISDFFFGD